METHNHNLDFLYYDKNIQLDILHEIMDFGDIDIFDIVNTLIFDNIFFIRLYTNTIEKELVIVFDKSKQSDVNLYKIVAYYDLYDINKVHIGIEAVILKNKCVNLDVYNREYKLREIGIIK